MITTTTMWHQQDRKNITQIVWSRVLLAHHSRSPFKLHNGISIMAAIITITITKIITITVWLIRMSVTPVFSTTYHSFSQCKPFLRWNAIDCLPNHLNKWPRQGCYCRTWFEHYFHVTCSIDWVGKLCCNTHSSLARMLFHSSTTVIRLHRRGCFVVAHSRINTTWCTKVFVSNPLKVTLPDNFKAPFVRRV